LSGSTTVGIAETAGGNVVNRDRMWHYVGMNEIARGPQLSLERIEEQIGARDRKTGNKYSKDAPDDGQL